LRDPSPPRRRAPRGFDGNAGSIARNRLRQAVHQWEEELGNTARNSSLKAAVIASTVATTGTPKRSSCRPRDSLYSGANPEPQKQSISALVTFSTLP
jgi:hypothetical protein